MKLKGKIALITGSSRGIGAEIAKKIAENGAFVIVNYLNSEKEALETVNNIKKNHGEAIAIKADVSNKEEIEKLVNKIITLKGKIDILVNNATKELKLADITKISWKDFEDEINISLKGAFNSSQIVLKNMIKNKGGSIINIISSVCVGTPPPNFTIYTTIKMALLGLSKSMAVDFAKHNIRINMVSPGIVNTKLTSFIPSFFKQKIVEQTPTKRLTTKEDIANAVVFLASEEAKQINGINLLINGGNPMF